MIKLSAELIAMRSVNVESWPTVGQALHKITSEDLSGIGKKIDISSEAKVFGQTKSLLSLAFY